MKSRSHSFHLVLWECKVQNIKTENSTLRWFYSPEFPSSPRPTQSEEQVPLSLLYPSHHHHPAQRHGPSIFTVRSGKLELNYTLNSLFSWNCGKRNSLPLRNSLFFLSLDDDIIFSDYQSLLLPASSLPWLVMQWRELTKPFVIYFFLSLLPTLFTFFSLLLVVIYLLNALNSLFPILVNRSLRIRILHKQIYWTVNRAASKPLFPIFHPHLRHSQLNQSH